MPKQLLLDARAAVQQVAPDNYFYGEGWNWGEVVDNCLFEQATQNNLANTEIGSFAQSSYADDPADIINYVSKHDNRTLGGDMLRSKSLDLNSYDAGDWFNRVDFTMTSNNWNVGLPIAQDNQYKWDEIRTLIVNAESAPKAADIQFASAVFKEMLSIRTASKLFRLTTGADVIGRVGFHNTGETQTPGLIVMSIDDGVGLTDLDPANDAIVIVVNGSNTSQTHTVNTAKFNGCCSENCCI